GVIVESIALKTEAFREVFSFVPDHVDEIVEFHLRNGGMSRFEKFRYIYEHMLHEELTDEQSARLGERFSAYVFDGMLRVPFVDGACDLLERYHGDIPLYVVSATPEEEIREIVKHREIDRFFDGVYGSPRSKADCIRDILEEHEIAPREALFIGDAPNDWEAAQATGVRFIARVMPGDENRFEGVPGVEAIVRDLLEAREYLERQV
ncbi:MAG: HAD family hydrolase, partial [Methanomicrobiales archaeon]